MSIQKIQTGVIEDDSITTPKFVNQSVTIEKLATSGTLPALDGSQLTGIVAGATITKDPNDPAIDTNPSEGLGALWLNTSQGYLWVCTDSTTDANVWKSASCGNDRVEPFPSHLGGTMIMFGSTDAAALTSQISYLTIATLGNSKFFGTNTNNPPTQGAAAGNTSRTLYVSSNLNLNQTVFLNPNTLGSSVTGGHATLITPRTSIGVCSDGTRVVVGGGDLGSFNTDSGSGDPGGGFLAATNMEFINIQNGGTAEELGDLNIIGQLAHAVGQPCDRNKIRETVGCSDGTHGYWVNGYGGFDNSNNQTNPPGAGYLSVIQKFTIQTNANCTQFGNFSVSSTAHIAETDGNRIIRAAGLANAVNAATPLIEFVANASGGSATNFGNFIIARRNISSATNGSRIVVNGNIECQDVIEYITPSTLGDAQDFGDMEHFSNGISAASGGSGGLG